MRRLLAWAIVASLWAVAPAGQAALPERDSFMTRVREALRLDDEVQQQFTYTERRRDAKIGALGKVTVGPLRTFEVFPATEPGRTYKRLIAIDGTPLDPGELARRDAERQRDLDYEQRRGQRESPDQRNARAERTTRESREPRAILRDAFSVFDAAITGRELLDGASTIVVTLTPRGNVRVATREGNWMKQFQGRAWFAEEDAQFARLDMQAVDDVSVGWGIVGRLHKGSRLMVERRKTGALWLPARLEFAATGRTLMFRPFELKVIREYGDYRPKN